MDLKASSIGRKYCRLRTECYWGKLYVLICRERTDWPRWPWSGSLDPCFVNTWQCDSWDHLLLCVHLTCACWALGQFCSVNTHKLHLKSPCAILWSHYGCVVAVCPVGQPQENIVSLLLLQLLCQPGENKHVCSSCDSLGFLAASPLMPCLPRVHKQWDTVARHGQ